jgi:2-polyprenyl-3-methyl-5-hydroxy-6-metoxy-1,4-benzoquinol methylase
MIAQLIERAVDSGLVPEPALRAAIRAVCAQRLREQRGTVEQEAAAHQAFVDELRRSPVAIATDAANAQHYEVPAEFFELVLGPRRKYSSCYWPAGVTTLAAAEDAMLELTAARAGLADGQRVLDLGCGWGSLSLWAAARWPGASFVGVSNSASQRASIEARAAAAGLRNLQIVTGDVRTLDLAALGPFDRVVSIEMFEHMRNYQALLARIAAALRPGRRAAGARVRAPALRVSLRGRRRQRLDGARVLHRRPDAVDGAAAPLSGRSAARGRVAPWRRALRPHQRGLVCAADGGAAASLAGPRR